MEQCTCSSIEVVHEHQGVFNSIRLVSGMTIAINCGFARVAVRELRGKHSQDNGQHSHLYKLVSEEYNTFFSLHPQMQLREGTYMAQQMKQICQLFNKQWHPQQRLQEYTSTFAMHNWGKLPTSQKQQHSCKD